MRPSQGPAHLHRSSYDASVIMVWISFPHHDRSYGLRCISLSLFVNIRATRVGALARYAATMELSLGTTSKFSNPDFTSKATATNLVAASNDILSTSRQNLRRRTRSGRNCRTKSIAEPQNYYETTARTHAQS
jgi:hypothetical protein